MNTPKPELADTRTNPDETSEPLPVPDAPVPQPEPSLAPAPTDAPVPEIPEAASQLIMETVQQSQVAQRAVAVTVSVVLAALGLSIKTHDILFFEGRAVIVKRP